MREKIFIIFLFLVISYLSLFCNEFNWYRKELNGDYELKNIDLSKIGLTKNYPRYIRTYDKNNKLDLIVSIGPDNTIYCIDEIANKKIAKSIYFNSKSETLLIIKYKYKNNYLVNRIVEMNDIAFKETFLKNNRYQITFFLRKRFYISKTEFKNEEIYAKFNGVLNNGSVKQLSGKLSGNLLNSIYINYDRTIYSGTNITEGIKMVTEWVFPQTNEKRKYIIIKYNQNENTVKEITSYFGRIPDKVIQIISENYRINKTINLKTDKVVHEKTYYFTQNEYEGVTFRLMEKNKILYYYPDLRVLTSQKDNAILAYTCFLKTLNFDIYLPFFDPIQKIDIKFIPQVLSKNDLISKSNKKLGNRAMKKEDNLIFLKKKDIKYINDYFIDK